MDTKFGDERFDRHYRQMPLGLRLLTHGARAQAACDWSGLTPDRLNTIKRRWLPEAGDGFRGPAPTSFHPHFRSATRAVYASLFAGIYLALAQLGKRGGTPRELLPNLENGELLCDAYEVFRMWARDSDLEFDQAVLLARGVSSSEIVELVRCPKCQGVVLIDKLARRKELNRAASACVCLPPPHPAAKQVAFAGNSPRLLPDAFALALGEPSFRRPTQFSGEVPMSDEPASFNRAPPKVTPSPPVVLPRWINESFPALSEILTARNVARLTRRPCWLLLGLSLLGYFPKRTSYRGRPFGWCRTEVLEWMSRDLKIAPEAPERGRSVKRRSHQRPRQVCLPLTCHSPCRARRVAREARR